MYANLEHFFEISYELTRFFFFWVLALYIVKAYVYPWIYSSYLSLQKMWIDLYEQKNLLVSTGKTLEEKREKQQAFLDSLDRKLHMWHVACINEVHAKQDLYKKNLEILNEKKKHQTINFREEKIRSEVFPHAIKESERYFENQYGGKEGRVLLKNLIDHLSKSS